MKGPNDRLLVRVPDLHRCGRIWALAGLAVRPGFHQHRPKFRGHRRDIPKYQNKSLVRPGPLVIDVQRGDFVSDAWRDFR